MIRNTMAAATFDRANMNKVYLGEPHEDNEIDILAHMRLYLKKENYINILRAL